MEECDEKGLLTKRDAKNDVDKLHMELGKEIRSKEIERKNLGAEDEGKFPSKSE